MSDEVKAELAKVVKQDFITTNDRGKLDGSKKPDVINKYLSTIPSTQILAQLVGTLGGGDFKA